MTGSENFIALQLHFIQFDINLELVKDAITFATRYTDVSQDMKNTILQATNSFLCSNGEIWVKKHGGIFDITMGGFHGAEICDLIGLFILSKLKEILPNIGLYRDDGLAVSSATNRQIEIAKKKICKAFEKYNLAVTIEANSKIVNFLDVTLDLSSGTYRPYMKENDAPVYVNINSNHPPTVLKSVS